jgi:phosphoribosylformimino-5-aminoimidazole carboxamide ribotide isomerase
MILYPAIDLKNGQCVRLLRGDMENATVFNDDPAAQARVFQEAGFQWLHLVDLDGAIEGNAVNSTAVRNILSEVTLPAQLGGGIRNMEAIDRWLEAGIARVILGTIALEDPALVKAACKAYPGKIAIGIDARNGMVAVKGWVETSTISAMELALRFEDAGAAAIVFTDIDRDGAMGGVNLDATVDLAFALSTPVIASGGVSSLHDLKVLKAEEQSGINGVIVGRALYDGGIQAKPALEVLK